VSSLIMQAAAHSSVISAFTYHTARRQTSENRRGDLKPHFLRFQVLCWNHRTARLWTGASHTRVGTL